MLLIRAHLHRRTVHGVVHRDKADQRQQVVLHARRHRVQRRLDGRIRCQVRRLRGIHLSQAGATALQRAHTLVQLHRGEELVQRPRHRRQHARPGPIEVLRQGGRRETSARKRKVRGAQVHQVRDLLSRSRRYLVQLRRRGDPGRRHRARSPIGAHIALTGASAVVRVALRTAVHSRGAAAAVRRGHVGPGALLHPQVHRAVRLQLDDVGAVDAAICVHLADGVGPALDRERRASQRKGQADQEAHHGRAGSNLWLCGRA
mmetsp:Transcript_8427/g.26407  ORF Transcript_8427/g.26407 Transcript_8427/m.26407 type:complete len:260 (+) Transcript_8427:3796-4575(+)